MRKLCMNMYKDWHFMHIFVCVCMYILKIWIIYFDLKSRAIFSLDILSFSLACRIIQIFSDRLLIVSFLLFRRESILTDKKMNAILVKWKKNISCLILEFKYNTCYFIKTSILRYISELYSIVKRIKNIFFSFWQVYSF